MIDRITKAYETEYANVHRGLHYLANAATEAFEAARETVRAFINAGSVDEIVFTRSATEAVNLVASSFGLAHIGEGDEIVLSIMEHHSNIVPWHFLRERKGAVLKWVGVDDDGNLSLEAFEAALSPRTKIVAMTHMSNMLGTDHAHQGDDPHRPCARHPRAWSTGRRAPFTSTSTCATSMRTSTSSPATRSTGRPASACSTARRTCSRPCRPSTAAAR